MDRGIFVSRAEAERTTLAEALERYKAEISSRKAHPAQDNQRISHWLRQPVAFRHLANLRGADFAQYRDARREQGRAENTIRLELALVSHLFEIARKEWGMESFLNPLKNIRRPSGSRERDRRLQGDEYLRISAALTASGNPWAGPAFDLAIETTPSRPSRRSAPSRPCKTSARPSTRCRRETGERPSRNQRPVPARSLVPAMIREAAASRLGCLGIRQRSVSRERRPARSDRWPSS